MLQWKTIVWLYRSPCLTLVHGSGIVMFTDDLKKNFRTKNEAAEHTKRESVLRAENKAKLTLEIIKSKLIAAAANGEYNVEQGKKIVSYIYELPNEFQRYLSLEKKDTSTPAVPNSLQRSMSQMVGKSKQECRRIIRQYSGKDLLSGGKPPERHCSYTFSVCQEADEFKFYFDKLQNIASLDKITIELCIVEAVYGTIYFLPVTIKDEWKDKNSYRLSVKCSCVIPDKHSTDIPVAITMEQSTEHSALDDGFRREQGVISEQISFDVMEGHDFERFCADILYKNGFENVDVTKGSGDQGVDIIAYKDGIKYGIQCKCYSADVGNKAVQEAYSGRAFYNCHVGVVLTNRFFTHSATELARKNGVILWDRSKLLELIAGAGYSISAPMQEANNINN